MTMRGKGIICAGLIAASPAAAYAQSSAGSPSPASSEADPQKEAAEQVGVADIVVTAQRREQRLQDVPIAVAAVTAETAQQFGTTGTDSLPSAVPSLQFNRQPGTGVTPFLRGVGSSEPAGAESEVAIYVDDVYIGNSSAIDFQFNNINSIEVLKGPQGTLFGRNATGGVIHVHTREPTHDAAIDLQGGYGSYDTIYGSLYATGGLTDTLAINFAATGRDQRKGYGRNLVTGADTLKGWNYGFRSRLLWEPSDSTTLIVSGDYSNQNSQAGGNFVVLPGTLSLAGGPAPTNRYGTYSTPADFVTNETWRVSGKLTQDLGGPSLVSITSYSETKQHFVLDLDGSPTGANLLTVDARAPSRYFSQELQLQSPRSDRFTWILGAFYYNSLFDFNQRLLGDFVQFITPFGTYRDLLAPLRLNSYSGFADGTFEIAPGTRLTGGLRYTSDRYKIDFSLVGQNGTTSALPRQAKTFSKLTYRAVLDHRFDPDVLGYASYSRGFKSGRFNISDGGEIQPETLDAYEIGVKSDLFDRMLRANFALFHYDYSNIQVSQNVGGVNQVRNAAAARINGTELDFTLVPTRNLTVVAGFAFLDAKYKSFPNGPFNVPNPAVCTPTPRSTGAPTGGFTTCSVELGGNRLPQAPKFAMNISANYAVPTSIGKFDLNASLYHNGGFYWESDNQFTSRRYNLLNASVTWHSPDEKFDVRVYGKNMLSEYYFSFQNSGSLGALGSPVMPDNYGAELTVHF